MSNNAANFRRDMMLIWNGRKGNENAVEVARRRKAKMGPTVDWEHYRETTGDIPAHKWIFPDASEIFIGDDGSIIQSVRSQGQRK